MEVNQGFGFHVGLNDGKETLEDSLVAGKKTAVVMKIPGSDEMTKEQAEAAKANYKLEAKAVTNGQEADSCELTADGSNFSVVQLFNKDCDLEKAWYVVANFPKGPDKGTYNFYIKNGDTVIGQQKTVNFYETKNLNILVVPVNGYWSAAKDGGAPSAGPHSCKNGNFVDADGSQKPWSELCGALKQYMLDVYPIADVSFEEGQELEAGTADYDMVDENSGGQKKLWEEACKLQSKKKDGSDRYDLILAFVQYRQGDGGGQGYTFGKPTNIITYSDKDMLPTVAHEIAHCYDVGDEYNGGSFNNKVNFPPNGYDGRDFTSGADIKGSSGADAYWQSPKDYKSDASVNSDKKDKVNENGAGTMVKLSLHPYSLSKEEFIRWAGTDASGKMLDGAESVCPTISWMGSGYPTDEDFQKDSNVNHYYWTNSVIWDHLLKALSTKSKKGEEQQEEQQQEEQSNAQIFANAVKSGLTLDENSVFTSEDDFYFDDGYRWGESRMVEVYGWMVKDATKDTGVKVEMNPMFSYQGDLGIIEPLAESYKDSKDIYTFVALGEGGKILRSPIDENGEQAKSDADKKYFAATEFYGGFFNPKTTKDQKEINFNFDAEYPVGTTDFAIVKGRLKEGENVTADGTFNGEIVWRASVASQDENDPFTADFTKDVSGELVYADVNEGNAEVEWALYYPSDSEQVYDNKDGALYTEVYYCPEGDDGESYYIGCSDDEGWEDGFISFAPGEVVPDNKTKWTRNAYVWVKVTNGVNGVDIYSDANEITLCNSTITLAGAGMKKDSDGSYWEYTGKAITPTVTVKAYDPYQDKDIAMKKDVDYSVTWENNVNAGTATVTVQGIGTYAGKNSADFEIRAKALAGAPESIPDMKYTATLDQDIVKYLVYKDTTGVGLQYKTDFTVKYSADGKDAATLAKLFPESPKSAVTVTVNYEGKGNFSGTSKKNVSFQVLPSESETVVLTKENTTVTLAKSEMAYTGKALKNTVKSVVYKDAAGNETKLKAAEYKVVITNNVNVGTARVTVIGKKNYAGSSYETFAITPKPVAAVTVSGLKNQNYTGAAVDVNKLPITVKAGGLTLTRGIDYTIEGSGNLTDVTTADIKKSGNAPAITIKLIAATSTTKGSEMPKVKWKNGEKPVKKTFAIVKTKLNSNAVTVTKKNSDDLKNVVKDVSGNAIATLRAASKQEKTENRKKPFDFVISGEADELVRTADLKEAIVLKTSGTVVDPSAYTITIKPAKNEKIGTITIKPAKGIAFLTGTKVVKYMYLKAAPAEPETPVNPDPPVDPEPVPNE